MAVAYFREFPTSTAETLQQIGEDIAQQVGQEAPQGGLYHAEGMLDDGGWWAFDVWESEHAANQFYGTVHAQALQAAGVADVEPRRLQVSWETSQMPGAS